MDSAQVTLRDDPKKDFRQRYKVPEQFVWDIYDLARIDFDGYMRVVADLLPPAPANVIDVGCGPGFGSQRLAERGYTVTGIDYSERAVGFAKLLVPECQFECLDVRLLGQAIHLHNRFDAAIHVEVIEHIPPEYHDQVLSGIHKALRPGGVLVLTVPSIHMSLNKWHYKHFTEDEAKQLLERNGFAVQRIVHQHRLGWVTSNRLHWLLCNQVYDLRIVRRWLRHLFLTRYSVTTETDKAGRLIIQARKQNV